MHYPVDSAFEQLVPGFFLFLITSREFILIVTLKMTYNVVLMKIIANGDTDSRFPKCPL